MMFGLILLPAAIVSLAWNEKNNVCQNNVFIYAEEKALVAPCGDSKKFEGFFTFYSCPVDENQTTFTPLSSFNMPGLQELVFYDSLAASQNIEMYQCIETAKKVDSGKKDEAEETSLLEEGKADQLMRAHTHKHKTTAVTMSEDPGVSESISDAASGTETEYTYAMGWANAWYDSHDFKATPENIQKSGCDDFVYNNRVNHNPDLPDRGDGKPIELGRQTVFTTNIKAGGFTFSDEKELKNLVADDPVSMLKFKGAFALPANSDNIVTAVNKDTVTVHEDSPNYLSTCKEDRLGCVRISYNRTSNQYISVIGYTGSSGVMEPWKVAAEEVKYPMAASYDCDVTPFIRMLPEEMTKAEMIASLKGENVLQTWGLRVGGMIGAWFGFYCLFDPFASYSDRMASFLGYIPFCGPRFGAAIEGIVEMFVCLITCSLGLGCGMMAAGLVWAGLRPVVGGPLVAGGVVMCAIGFAATYKAWRDPRKMIHNHGKADQHGHMGHSQFGEHHGQPFMKGGHKGGEEHPGEFQGHPGGK